MMNLLNKVKQTIQKYSLLSEGERVVVGLSGGPDSMALLDILCSLKEEYNLTLIPSHLNHGFRGQEAAEDLIFCEKAAAGYGLTLISEYVDLPVLIREQGLSPQAAARDIRYDFFLRTAATHGAAKIALGHHADDQAETFLMRLFRGAGARGLSGIPIQREPGIIRPLLYATREEILSYLEQRGIPSREDSSNKKEIYLRNRIRGELIPLLKERYNPNLVEDLQRTARILGEEDDFLQELAESRLMPMPIPEGVAVDLTKLKDLSLVLARRIIRTAMERTGQGLAGMTFRHVDAVMDLIQVPGSSARVDLPHGLQVRKVYDRLEFCRERDENPSDGLYEIAVPGREEIPALEIEVETRILPPKEAPEALQKSAALFDMDKCSPPLCVRTRAAGDVFYPKGFGKRKKLKRFFIDEKVPYPARDRVPLLVNSSNEILWVGGYRTDDRFTVDAGTSRALLVRIRRINGGSHAERR